MPHEREDQNSRGPRRSSVARSSHSAYARVWFLLTRTAWPVKEADGVVEEDAMIGGALLYALYYLVHAVCCMCVV